MHSAYHHRMSRLLPCLLLGVAVLSRAQQPAAPATPPPTAAAPDTAPLPDIRQFVLDVERNQRAAEAARRDYTYHLQIITQELGKNGDIRQTESEDYESVAIDGVRVERQVARNGKPFTPEQAKKESERFDKEVAKEKEHRAKLDEKGKPSTSHGDEVITASRILELGTFSNPRRVMLNGRPTIVADYAGDPHAKTRNSSESVIRDLVGTAWFDEQDRALVQAEGHFLNDFKIAGGLFLSIHQGFSFSFQSIKVNNEVWLPKVVDATGEARIFLLAHIDGRFHMTASDYRKFRSTSRIVGESAPLGPDDQPLPATPPPSNPQP